jgi:phosphate transport system substrate-binding protein
VWRLGLALLLAGWSPGCQKPADTSPSLVYAGSGSISDTVLPPLSEGFVQRGGPPVEPRHYVGSGEGFKFVMEGRADLGGLARSLTSTEKVQHPYYVIIGYAALAVYVHPDNPLPNLTRAQLKAFFTGEVKNWKQVGGPDAPVELVTVNLSTGSGTPDFFRDAVMEGAPCTGGSSCRRRRTTRSRRCWGS